MLHFFVVVIRHGPAVLASGCILGLMLPGVSNLLKPAMPFFVFIFMLGTLLRVDNEALIAVAKKVRLSVVFPLLMIVVAPCVFGTIAFVLSESEELSLAIAVSLAAPPASGNSAVARMLGLDPATSLVVALFSMALIPITAPWVVQWVSNSMSIGLDPWALAGKLLLLVGGAEGAALVIRRYSKSWVNNHGMAVDGVVVVSLFAFAIATMDGLHDELSEDPARVMAMIGIAYCVNVTAQLIFGVLCPGGLRLRFTLALNGGNRNIGLLWAALGACVSPTVALYLACCQLPIHTMPKLLQFLLPKIEKYLKA